MHYFLCMLCAVLAWNVAARGAEKFLVFAGTYTGGTSQGIYAFELELKSGRLTSLGLAAESTNPTFLALHPGGKLLFAANEIGNFRGGKGGAVTSFRIEAETGRLQKISEASTVGAGPCHLVVDRTGRHVLVANYSGGSVCVLPVDEQGVLGEASAFVQHAGSSVNAQRQSAPHAHSINLDQANRFAMAADLGLDQVLIYQFDPAKGTLAPHQPAFVATPPGGGPRHFAFHPGGRRAYVNNELTSSVTAFAYDPDRGTLRETQTITTLPVGWKGQNSTAEIQVHPSGQFVYCSNRGHNSVAVYAVDPNGILRLVENESTRGKTPRNFGVDPSGTYLIAANQDSDSLSVFRIDPKTGALDPVGEPVTAPRPVCIKFLARP